MASYTNDSLDKLCKQELIPIVLFLQSKLDKVKNEANNKVLEEVSSLSDTITKLSSELSITKNVNTILSSRLVTLERQCGANAQYSRRECLDFVSIPREVSGEALEETVLNIFDKLGCSISPDHIESCHRISKKSDTVIVKFSRRKDCQQVWQVKKDLQELKIEDVDLTRSNKLFINRCLCPCYKVLWSKSKKLHNLDKIHNFFISGDTVKIKINESSAPLPVTHVDDFGNYFPDVDLSPHSR